MVNLLLNKGASPSTCDKKDRQPLHWAAFLGHLEVLKLLVARGADVACKDRKGYTLLHTAAASGQIEVVRHLLRLGVEVRPRELCWGWEKRGQELERGWQELWVLLSCLSLPKSQILWMSWLPQSCELNSILSGDGGPGWFPAAFSFLNPQILWTLLLIKFKEL
ncbi:ankyrin repeat domain-containing protein 1-like [Parus major]|uniref:ankyrin repeat domain-containing protein 1-like n=1 Tax=Parus major TaxID=9157 RepID=UPI00144416DC|nr:ankyrin repeat domain-containing protein 1-like [Parus major]